MSELEVRNDEIESDLKDKMLKLAVLRKRAKRATKKWRSKRTRKKAN